MIEVYKIVKALNLRAVTSLSIKYEYSMLKLIFNNNDMIHFFFKLASSRGAPQENDAKFRFAIHPQGFRQFHDNCKIAKCQALATLAPKSICVLLAQWLM